MEKRESGRIKDGQARRILDEASRKRRARKALEALEADNFQDDPHADLKMSKYAPKFEDSFSKDGGEKPKQKKAKRKSDYFKYRAKKSFAALLEEEQLSSDSSHGPNYLTIAVPPSRFPERKFCSVCGFPSTYTCIQCGVRYCSVKCLGTHQDTRCLKWTA